MSEKVNEEWLACPTSVKEALPRKIKIAVGMALDECFLEIVGTPDAQKDRWVYKTIKTHVCAAMKGWVEEAIDEAIGKAIEK